ncbi:sigma-70 family RNA polymerase sigma factor [Ruficoccus sp. ZRK36]|uniref:RNA polymerase sigma factor n=1 Tax=Ruficoccus sp. ZRK36 TaxID=2866311 RepID=UPI001C7311D2|nr:sigma-70 family RNA polymerase sigma factor [Ruficoccus sp. ZRK36]QYY37315.1 sigma-70 family RNA polymerase sigma factor [Ruficoccus sp. ZRK36]
MEETRTSLLERVRSSDRCAWEDFYRIYWEPIVRYARKLGVKEPDAYDVLQETMVVLMDVLPRFRYDRSKGRFRNFLLTIVHRKCLAAFRRGKRRQETSWEALGEPAEPTPEPVDPNESLWRESLMHEALRRLEGDSRIRPATLAAFREYALEGQSASEVAKKYGLKENALYQIRNRMVSRLSEEVEQLARMADLRE